MSTDESPWEGPMTPEMWVKRANDYLSDMCALAGSHGVNESALNMMEAFGGNVRNAVEEMANELERESARNKRLSKALVREVSRFRAMHSYIAISNRDIEVGCKLQPGDIHDE